MNRSPSPASRLAETALPHPVFTARARVYYEDTDAGGIVYHANWLRFFERARTDWLRALGANHQRLAREDGLILVVRDMRIDYRQPAQLDDELMIDVRLLQARGASLRLMQSALGARDGTVLVRADLRVAAISTTTRRATGLPRWLVARLNEAQSPLCPEQGTVA